jgi:outer membrane protein assembly factor BamD (BamD/ComL family)
MMRKHIIIALLQVVLTTSSALFSKEEPEKVQKTLKTKSAYDYYNEILNAYQSKQWKPLIISAKSLIASYSDSPFNAEAYYYKGVAYYNLDDYDLANESFTKYLRNETTPKFFEDAIDYKYQIAEKFYQGARKHFWGLEKMPRILPARDEALEIYEEIITTLPRHDLTAKSLYKKGCLLSDFNDYKSSVEAFQVLIRRFPKHYYAPEGFIGIQKVYLKQAQLEFPDPDVLELAEINLQRFKENFPGEPRIEEAKKMLVQMEDCFAADLFETGSFYERTKKDEAAAIYYTSLLSRYPNSAFAQKAKKHLDKINRKKTAQSKKSSKTQVSKK